jgi:hypothetical protein
MRQIIKLTATLILLFAASNIYAQDIEKVRTALTAAREAYEGGDWRTAIAKATELERLIGTSTKPATAYIKIMSYYKLNDYDNCVRSASTYINGGEAAKDETLVEVRRVMQDSQTTLNRQREAAEQWAQISNSTDLVVLSAFIAKYSDTPSAASARARYDDERAWQNTLEVWSGDAIEAYLNGNTEKRYAPQAKAALEEAYPVWINDAAEAGNIEYMEYYYDSYTGMFPQGSRIGELQTTMGEVYYDTGMSLSKNRNSIGDLRQSVGLLDKAHSYSHYDVASTIRRTNRRITDLSRNDGGYIGIAYDKQTYIGLSTGALNQRKFGWYFTLKGNFELFNSGVSNHEELEDGTILRSYIYDKILQDVEWVGKPITTGANLNIGITKRVFYPIWVYAGAGASYTNTMQKFKGYSVSEGMLEVEDTIYRYGAERVRPNVDVGVIAVLRPITLSVGVRYDFNEAFFTACFGFSIF